MNQALEKTEKWLAFLDEVIVWSIFAFIILLPLPHVTALKSIAKVLPVVAWITKMVMQQRLLFKKNTLSWPILGYLGACLLSVIHSGNVIYSLHEIRSDVISPILLYLVIVNTIQQKHLRTIFNAFLISAIVISVYGIWAFINGTNVLDGRVLLTFNYHTIAGRYIGVLIALTLGLLYIARSWWGKGGVIICLLVSLIALFMTQARQAIVATLIASIIFAFLRDKRLLLVILLVLTILLPLLPKNTVDRLKTIVNIDTYTKTSTTSTISSRYDIWQAAVLMLKDNWLWGVGYGWKNVHPLSITYRDKYGLEAPDPIINHAHNVFLQEWLEIGLVGFVMFMWLVVNIFRKMWAVFRRSLKDRAEGAYTAAVIAATCGLFITGMVAFFLRYEMVYLFWIIIGLLMLLAEKESGLMASRLTHQQN